MRARGARYTAARQPFSNKEMADITWKVVLTIVAVGSIAWLSVLTVNYDEQGSKGRKGADGVDGNTYLQDRVVVNETTASISVVVDAETPVTFHNSEIHLNKKVRVNGVGMDTTRGFLDVRVGNASANEKVVVQGYGSTPMPAVALASYPSVTVFNGEGHMEGNPAAYALVTTSAGNAGAVAGHLEFGATRSTSAQVKAGVHTALNTSDPLGTIAWRGDDGTSLAGAGAWISASMVGAAANATVPATVTHWAERQIKFSSSIKAGTGFEFNPSTVNTSSDALIGFNGGQATVGYAAQGPISSNNAFQISTSQNLELVATDAAKKVLIKHNNSGTEISVEESGLLVSSGYARIGHSPGTSPGHQFIVNNNGGTPARVMFRSQNSDSMVEIYSHNDGNPGHSACLSLGNKYDNVAGSNVPDNAWMMCNHAGTGPNDFAPSLTVSHRINGGHSSDWPSPSNDSSYATDLEVKKDGDTVVRRNLRFDPSEASAGVVLPNPAESPSGVFQEYADTTYGIELSGAWNVSETREFHITRVGRMVTLQWWAREADANTTASLSSADGAVPRWAHPIFTVYQPIAVIDNSVATMGRMSVTLDGKMYIFSGVNSLFTGSGKAGMYGGAISYIARYTTGP